MVGGQVVSACRYKPDWSDKPLMGAFLCVWEALRRWQPADAFVVDVASGPFGHKVIEVNCFNSAGLYACDPGRIIDAVEALPA